MKRIVCGVCLAIAVLSTTARADIFYPNFSSTTGLNLEGVTARSGNILRLTPAAVMDHGAAWYATQQSLDLGFSTTFQFQITSPPSGGADGFAFVVQNQIATAIGSGTGSENYKGIAPSLVVEFDTYNNGSTQGDTNNNHIAIQRDGSYAPANQLGYAANLPFDLNDGSVHTATISYLKETLSIALDSKAVWSGPVDIDSILGSSAGKAWVGFTAGTGSVDEAHDILNWSLTTVPEPGTLALLATGLVGLLVYAWHRRRHD
jgi:hypothetical protein